MVDGKLRLKITTDNKTKAKITGILGKRLGLDKSYYSELDREHLELLEGFKIFMFHCAINELKPKSLSTIVDAPISLLPKGFDYYAGGHVHIVMQQQVKEYGLITYPGPIFPNSFSELEELQRGGFFLYDNGKLEWQPLQIKSVFSITIDCNNKNPTSIEKEILDVIRNKQFYDTIVTIRLFGTMGKGKPSELGWNEILATINEKSPGCFPIYSNA